MATEQATEQTEQKKYVSLVRLSDYNELIKQQITEGDNNARTYTDEKVSTIGVEAHVDSQGVLYFTTSLITDGNEVLY